MRTLLSAVLMLAACGKHATKAQLGPTPTPPDLLAKIAPGMSLEDIKAIVPDAKDGDRGVFVGHDGPIDLYADLERGAVTNTEMVFAGEEAELVAAWGPSDARPAPGVSIAQHTWRSHGWRAESHCSTNGGDRRNCSVKFYRYKPLEEMLTASVLPPGRMAKAKPDMPLADLRKAIGDARLGKDTMTSPTEFEGVTERTYIDKDRLNRLGYYIPPEALPLAKKAWGPGTTTGNATMWCDAKTGWCASTEDKGGQSNLEMYGFMPFDKEIDVMEEMAAMPSLEAAQKAHPELLWENFENLPQPLFPIHEYVRPLEASQRHLLVGARAVPSGLFIQVLNIGDSDAVVSALTKKWGEPVKTVDTDGTHYTWPKHGQVLAMPDNPSLGMRKAANLIVSRGFDSKKNH